MLVGAISDIHGNLPAFEAVMEDLPVVDRIVCAGDVVGYNPWPEECVSRVRERNIPCVSGNHDRAVTRSTGFRFNSQAQAAVEHAREELSDGAFQWLNALPTTCTIDPEGIRIVHGHPDDPDRYTFPAEFSSELLGQEELLVLGHTHVQHDEVYKDGIVVNPGSVGQPRDGDPRAAYSIVDLSNRTVERRRVEYDIARVRSAIERAGLPRGLGERLEAGR